MMDIEKLIELLSRYSEPVIAYKLDADFAAACMEAANELAKIPSLQAENEKLRAELEEVKRERDALIEDFVDYVTGGVPNPAIFCKNRCNKCVDMRSWCTGKDCKGFYPSVASGQKED